MLIMETVENWWDIIAVRLGLAEKAILHYRNGLEVPYEVGQMRKHVRLAYAIRNGIDIRLWDNDKLSFSIDDAIFQKELDEDGLYFLYLVTKLSLTRTKFLNGNTMVLPNNVTFRFSHEDATTLLGIYETFFEEVYGLLNVKNRTVLDIGSFIGDTPIYFALKGATRVYAYEPNKETFSYLLENVKLNNMEDKVLIRNIAVASKRGRVCLIPENSSGHSYVSLEKNEHGYWVDAETLPMDIDILKMDCEGCEYDVLLNVSPGSMRFQEIMLEFHGDYRPLTKILLREGYMTKIVKKYTKRLGLLYAELKK